MPKPISVTVSSISSVASISAKRSGDRVTSGDVVFAIRLSRRLGFRIAIAAPLGVRLPEVGDSLFRRGLNMAQHRQADDLVAIQQLDAAHAGAVTAGENPHLVVGQLEANAPALAGRQQHVVALAARGDTDQVVALVKLHRDQARRRGRS